MYSELSNYEKNLYIRVLEKSSYYKSLLKFTNFQKQKSKGAIFHINKILFDLIHQIKCDKNSRILPILLPTDIEKAHFYDLIKDKEEKFNVIYIPNPPPYVRIFFHIYNCIIKEHGFEILEKITDRILTKYIKTNKKTIELGLKDILQKGKKLFSGKQFDCFKLLMIYKVDVQRKDLAKRWLLGVNLSREDLGELRIKSNIEEDVISFEMIKLISEFSNQVIVLYFDDIEKPFENYGERAEIKLLEALKRLLHDVRKLMIIMSSVRKSWNKILNITDQSFYSILEPAEDFLVLNGLKKFIEIAMDIYWVQNDLKSPVNPYFPLDSEILNLYYQKTNGNIKNFLNLCINSIERIGNVGLFWCMWWL